MYLGLHQHGSLCCGNLSSGSSSYGLAASAALVGPAPAPRLLASTGWLCGWLLDIMWADGSAFPHAYSLHMQLSCQRWWLWHHSRCMP